MSSKNKENITSVSAEIAKKASDNLKSRIFESNFIFVTDKILTGTCLYSPENGSKQANTDRKTQK